MAVKVLVMYPEWYFDFYDDSNTPTVNVHSTETPSSVAISKTVQIRKVDLDWSPSSYRQTQTGRATQESDGRLAGV